MKDILLYFGSFNPVHVGHLIVAQTALNQTSADSVWFVVSPQSPDKQDFEMAEVEDRCNMVELAINDNPNMVVTRVELELPKPNYAIETLSKLEELYPDKNFSILIGKDNLIVFHKWKNYQDIISKYRVVAYPRYEEQAIPEELKEGDILELKSIPLHISSTNIRKLVKDKKSARYQTPDVVLDYINRYQLYKAT